jgi:hypothetical protein
MNWLDGDHVVTPSEAFQQWKLCFVYADVTNNRDGISMGSVQSAYKRSEFTSQFSSGQLQVVVDRKSGSCS